MYCFRNLDNWLGVQAKRKATEKIGASVWSVNLMDGLRCPLCEYMNLPDHTVLIIRSTCLAGLVSAIAAPLIGRTLEFCMWLDTLSTRAIREMVELITSNIFLVSVQFKFYTPREKYFLVVNGLDINNGRTFDKIFINL